MTTALVTGGNRGIGLAIARALHAEGMDVCLAARSGGEAAAQEIGCRLVEMDLASDASIEAGLAAAGPVDVLVNNAGVLWEEGLWDDPGHFDESFAVMVRAPFRLMRALVPGMGPEGRVVNVSSGWGSFDEGLGGGGAYGPAKAALNALTVRAAEEAPEGVKINAMCPGWVRTRMGGPGANRSPEQAAGAAVWLATLPPDGPTGGFFRDRRPIPW
ncbi:SDR family NAD(P)-dependent oxidoreductase [Jannaschia seohaensis]|uniref:NAD(P)-dependent dehydrogenase (Short-subunit alcohol dehydrogenase family) n=1 Tax=Jannaschia seohaensis TaxID=475081 RepID=A0A2Y9B251_9RHOB|nr:SDR family NAD(P)-dependent oxidoreductase [Jannaschia seohaensis]PWJ13284.1 NAD(P)-dependent dehydrogenase (short-subunit alcohol dehydrogenase family) [Jannaschia seohaensis]SSA50610.1 NAD(P)-dependent dehydrogenase, short-chain alcohol dehydrogenase family [Jannaschia seohaensis]